MIEYKTKIFLYMVMYRHEYVLDEGEIWLVFKKKNKKVYFLFSLKMIQTQNNNLITYFMYAQEIETGD